MARKITLATTGAQLAALITACDKVRKGTKSVTVDRQALMNLITDQSEIVNAARLVIEPEAGEGEGA
jgi:hypothetical protein